ncbi:uncharacterized protein LOC110862335 [Folsomia candida]|nr:uncharacterized protein LOC110862335 [Folsomia candida]XP_021967217.1 uncharacterized protein LOC110862335 [Folsomia candida]
MYPQPPPQQQQPPPSQTPGNGLPLPPGVTVRPTGPQQGGNASSNNNGAAGNQKHQPNYHQQHQPRSYFRQQGSNHLNNGGGKGGKGAYRTSSWTGYQNQNHAHVLPSGRGGNNNNVAVSSNPAPHPAATTSSTIIPPSSSSTNPNLGRSFSMSSFHPPLCAYTPSPGVIVGAWANGPPSNLGVSPPLGGFQHGPHQQGQPSSSSFGHHFGGFNSQFPFYFNNTTVHQQRVGGILQAHGTCVPPSSGANGGPSHSKMGPTIPAQPNSISDPGGKAASSGSGSSSTSANSSSIEAQTGNNSSEAGETVVSDTSHPPPDGSPPMSTPDPIPPPSSPPPVYRMPKKLSITHNLCRICCGPNGRLCLGCRHVAYCSERCQRQDWPTHISDCNPAVLLNKKIALEYLLREGVCQGKQNRYPAGREGTNEGIIGDVKRHKKPILIPTPCPPETESKKLEFRRKIAQKSKSVPNIGEKMDDVASCESSPHTPHADDQIHDTYLDDTYSSDSDLDGSTPNITDSSCDDGEGDARQEKWNGKMLTAKNLEPCDMVASLSPVMITCCNTMLTPNPPDSVTCLNCTRWYQASLGYRCSTCRWPVCSFECEKSYLHAFFECKVFAATQRFPPALKDHTQFFNDAVLMIRCLLLKTVNPPKYLELYELLDICDKYEKKPEFVAEDLRIVKFLRDECNIESFTDDFKGEAELMRFINVVDVCSIVVNDRIFIQIHDQGKSYYAAKYVFPVKLFVTQECVPNCKWSIKHSSKFEDCALRIHAAVPLPAQNYVTTCFTDKHVIGSWFQSELLNSSKFNVRCDCRRCRDPSECGSYFSAVRCECNKTKDVLPKPDGYLLPRDPLNPDTAWICQSPECGLVIDGGQIRDKTVKLHEEIHRMNEDFYALHQFKWKLEQTELHPNHFLILKISVLCVMLFWGSVRGLPFFSSRYDFFIATVHLANDALRIYDHVSPGMSIHRARILFQFQVAQAYKSLRDVRRYMEWKEREGTRQGRHKQSPTPGCPVNFWSLIGVQQEANAILKTEPYGTMEYEMGVILQEIIEDQYDLLATSLKDVNLEMAAVYNLHRIYTRFSNQYYYPSVPVYEDKDIQEFLVMIGPCARHLVEKINFPF